MFVCKTLVKKIKWQKSDCGHRRINWLEVNHCTHLGFGVNFGCLNQLWQTLHAAGSVSRLFSLYRLMFCLSQNEGTEQPLWALSPISRESFVVFFLFLFPVGWTAALLNSVIILHRRDIFSDYSASASSLKKCYIVEIRGSAWRSTDCKHFGVEGGRGKCFLHTSLFLQKKPQLS